uniref:DUF4408 domain-containing protein n=1 Tax=Noccaea caerulescens TaxID=107243 RepID=A0A1J3HUY0_NOCCA
MIDSVLELVNKTFSNSLFMFLFCNFIIILIIIGNYKPGSEDKENPGLQEPILISDTVLSSRSGFEKTMLKSESVLSSKYGFDKSVLKSKSVISSKFVVPASKLGFQEPVLISEPVLSSKPAGPEQTLISKPGLQIMSSGLKSGSDISENEKGRTKQTESFEEKEGEVECVLRRRVEEFISKVNTQWKSENTKYNYLLY